jgi:hypothetical protein
LLQCVDVFTRWKLVFRGSVVEVWNIVLRPCAVGWTLYRWSRRREQWRMAFLEERPVSEHGDGDFEESVSDGA